MPRKARPNPKPKRKRIYIREWREHAPKFKGRKLTLAKLSERLEAQHEIQITEGQLSRIERGEQPYNQDLLEAVADILGVGEDSLIMRDPTKPERMWGIKTVNLTDAEQERVAAYIEGLLASRDEAA
jgi:transcriptional regulator with XRE-family HTH domain